MVKDVIHRKTLNEFEIKTMLMKYMATYLIGILISLSALSQAIADQPISVDYQAMSLKTALEDMRQNYGINFSYINDHIPNDAVVSVQSNEESLTKVLDEIFEDSGLEYKIRGNRILLKKSKKVKASVPKKVIVAEREKEDVPVIIPKATVTPPVRELYFRKSIKTTASISTIPSSNVPNLHIQHPSFRYVDPNLPRLNYSNNEYPILVLLNDSTKENQLAQLSLFPFLRTSQSAKNKVSLNIFWGRNESVEGVEFGGIANSLDRDMTGLQLAGLVNSVGGDVKGVQGAGIVNINAGRTVGFQGAGIGNINTSKTSSEAVHVAGLFNLAADTKFQIAGLLNIGRDIEGGQIALLNIGRDVKGTQIGLINFSRSSDVPIGLLSLVKKGYNNIELSYNEVWEYNNLAIRLGADAFYNILQASANPSQKAYMYGYGIGTCLKFHPKAYANIELIANKVNEAGGWKSTQALNMLAQSKWTMNVDLLGHISLFVGPTLNVSISNLYNPDTQEYGSRLIPDHVFLNETTNDGYNIKQWIGYSGGIRLQF